MSFTVHNTGSVELLKETGHACQENGSDPKRRLRCAGGNCFDNIIPDECVK